MAKFKSGNIVARAILGETWLERNNADYLHAGFDRSELNQHAYSGRTSDNDDDDGSSIISISTTATTDDAPGTGRTLDTYIFQPMGRRIERLAMRFTIASLDPAHIAQYIETDIIKLHPFFTNSKTLHNAIADLCSWRRNGSTVVAGMKGLVKQTQSNSVDRSASALAALIRVSLSLMRRDIYVNISRIEPIFHLESLVHSHPDKKWLLLLVKLARESLIAVKPPKIRHLFDPLLGTKVPQLWPSLETATNLRQRLIRVLKVYRCSRFVSLDDTIGEACAICAEAISTCIDLFARGDAYMHILDTVYFTIIFIFRSIYELADLARMTANTHIYMVLRTIACWVDAIVYQCVYAPTLYEWRFDMELQKANVAFRSLIFVDSDTRYMLLPLSYNYVRRYRVLDQGVLPRRNREAREWYEEAPVIQSLIETAKQRTRRLLISLDELEREVWGCGALRTNITASQSEIAADPHWLSPYDFGDEWWNCWKSTLERAQKVQVSENELTEKFREARRIGPSDDIPRWAYYQLHRLSRHKWGQYLRSNMDWDWDLGSCMKRLFKVEKQTSSPDTLSPPASSSEIDVAAGPGGILKISMGEAQGSLPKEVQIAYKTENGETQYMSFVPAFPVSEHRPAFESFSIESPRDESMDPHDKSNPVIAQDD